MILQHTLPVHEVRAVARNIFVLSLDAPAIAPVILPGQFLNLRIEPGSDPLLRRPFSVYRTEGERIEIIFQVIGRGTGRLSLKRPGETLDALGPLGTPFGISGEEYETALLLGGGLGVAPLPLATEKLKTQAKAIVTFLGARTRDALVRDYLENVRVATDDGSEGFLGTVVELLDASLAREQFRRPKIFACGPTPMLRSVAALAVRLNIPCEVSLEGPMGCGIGICQGCPVELEGPTKQYALMCKDGPTFDVRRIKL
jgi:dihydroorotate dehydrogenase electron transfer subunit